MSSVLSVCVIGAGPAGLAVARALKERHVPYVHLERHTGAGGIWDINNPGTPMYESAHFISSKTVSGFSGFPMPEHFADYPSHKQILSYLQDFAGSYGLSEHVEFGVEVTEVVRSSSGWQVTRADGVTTEHSAVVVCTGAQWHPYTPEISGNYTGEVRHSNSYRDHSEFADKRVLVVGGGNSGCDIACDAAHSAKSATISMRRGYWFIPKHVFGIPSDIIGGAGSALPKPVERAVLQPLLRLLTGDPTRLGLQRPDHKLFETHPVLNSQLFHFLQHGDILAKPDISHAEGKKVFFTDGTHGEYDLVMFATGFQHQIPIAQQYFGSEQHPEDLYLTVFSRAHEGLMALGQLETNSGAYQLFDMLSHIIAGYLRDKRDGNPPAKRFETLIQSDRPDLSNWLQFDSSPRHTGYVDSDAFARKLQRTGQKFRWRLSSPPPPELAGAQKRRAA